MSNKRNSKKANYNAEEADHHINTKKSVKFEDSENEDYVFNNDDSVDNSNNDEDVNSNNREVEIEEEDFNDFSCEEVENEDIFQNDGNNIALEPFHMKNELEEGFE